MFVNETLSPLKVEGRKLKSAITNFFETVFKDNMTEQGQVSNISDGVIVMAFRSAIASYGYQIETHKVLTADGYILKIHKVTSRVPDSFGIKRRIVLLHHGLFGCSMDWLLLGPKDSLPFILLESGLEVWLANSRGNQFSKEHISRSVSSAEFWDFTFHEIGVYDLRAILEYLYDTKSEHADIVFLGYSLSGTSLLVLLSLLPEYNNMIKSAVLLAPLVFMNDIKGPLKDMSDVYHENYNSTMLIGRNQEELLKEDESLKGITEKYCKGNKVLLTNSLLCLKYGMTVMSRMDELLVNSTSGGSEKTLIHYFQMIQTKRFEMFDYGIENNSRAYGLSSPPEYPLNDVSVPLYIFTSTADTMSTRNDINKLKSFVPFINHTVLNKSDFSHPHFILGRTAPELLYKNIAGIINYT
ncbi:unnamed protein product [Pieris macdunnoughi]|uniref:Lipase n=1 Tax=Pieris macdunnoughi TaxID=345717 RepID=A0A821L3H4_9NEOP|nr:unnamed protein product [Pieris macdunnoughi]